MREATTSIQEKTHYVAVVGCGSIGLRHLDILKRMPGVVSLAIPKRAGRAAELEAQSIASVRSLEEAAKRGVTSCIIASDTSQHTRDAVLAMELKMNLLVEKPLAVTASDAQPIRDAAERLERDVFVGCCLRFSDSLNQFRSRLNTLGRIDSVRIECQSYLPDWRPGRDYRASYSARADEGGVLRDLIHEIDYAGWLYGWPKRLQAHLRNDHILGIEAEESADLFWDLRDGGVVSMRLDYVTRPTRRRMTAVGENGTLEWDGTTGTVLRSVRGHAADRYDSPQTRDEMFLEQARAFFEAGTANPDARLAGLEDGIRALRVCDAARQASSSRCEVQVEGMQ